MMNGVIVSRGQRFQRSGVDGKLQASRLQARWKDVDARDSPFFSFSFCDEENLLDQRQKNALVVAAAVVLHELCEWFSVDDFESFFDVLQIDFGARDDDTNQSRIVGSSTLHGSVKPGGEVVDFAFGALNYGQHSC